MRDLAMVAVMVVAILLLAAYVAFCDRIVTSADDDAKPVPGGVARHDPEVTA
jgi:hypothetical protein